MASTHSLQIWREGWIIESIGLAPIRTFPYPHLYLTGIFTDEMYAQLLSELRMLSEYRLKSDYPGKKTQVHEPDALTGMWLWLSNFVRGQAFRNALLAKFDLKPQGRSLCYLHRDLSGFCITPHTDVEEKLVSYLFYFPKDESRAHLGTWLCKPRDSLSGSELWRLSNETMKRNHHPFALFDKVGMAPYLPNSLFVWPVTDKSYHAVDIEFPSTDPVQARHTLRGFVFRDDMDLPYTFREDFAMPDRKAENDG